MPESSDLQPLPTRRDVETKLLQLVDGECTREDAASWAAQWFLAGDLPMGDPVVWDALGKLMGADLKTIDRPYLHDEGDFRSWLEELQNAPADRDGEVK